MVCIIKLEFTGKSGCRIERVLGVDDSRNDAYLQLVVIRFGRIPRVGGAQSYSAPSAQTILKSLRGCLQQRTLTSATVLLRDDLQI